MCNVIEQRAFRPLPQSWIKIPWLIEVNDRCGLSDQGCSHSSNFADMVGIVQQFEVIQPVHDLLLLASKSQGLRPLLMASQCASRLPQ
jgi:hypothetical protein